ncbi:M3 family metallopeptidase [Vibrio lentus]|nr:M3 family metallopeptidase [Vibrio lentus]
MDTWHESVRFFDIFDATGTSRGSFYLDSYARNTNVVALGWTTVAVVDYPIW